MKYNFNLSLTIFTLKEMKYFYLPYFVLVSLIIPITNLHAADFQKGYEAHLKGDYISAIKEWGPLAAQGDAAAQFNIGNMFDFGKGVAEDNAQAVYWYNKSAEQGNANAQYALGWMYENGEGVVNDLAMAFKWYKRAAERDNPAAQTNLGWMYENGKGVVTDDVQSVYWYRQAAELGQAE